MDMGRNRQIRSQQQQNRNVAEACRIRISEILNRFRASSDRVYTFGADYSNHERAVVHQVCKKMGLKSKSSGKGNQRCVSVYKAIKKEDNKVVKEGLANFTFSEESKRVLEDLFANYPPEDGNLADKMIGKDSEKANKERGKKDEIFCKPSINKKEIAKKMDSLASRVEKDANFRQVL
uniref:ATP-dependent RNA helicase n=1 Tax=Rhizophora mucronata TaxID=61149 RepID=A0A2P2LDZ6_RHIMU